MSGPNASGLPDAEISAQTGRFYGIDIWFDVSHPGQDGAAQYIIDPSSDLRLVDGREGYRQSMIRRMTTDPDEWPTLAGYGAGLRSYVKERNTPAKRAEAESRVREQALRDPRTASVTTAVVSPLEDGSDGIRLRLTVIPVAALGDAAVQINLEIH